MKSRSTKKPNLLLIDDESEVLRIYSEHLEDEGYNVTTYETAEPALEAVLENPDRFDLALVDYSLPGMDGITFTRKVRGVQENMPVILISGYVNNPQKKLQFSVDVDVIMTKPIDLEKMVEVIERALNPEMYEE